MKPGLAVPTLTALLGAWLGPGDAASPPPAPKSTIAFVSTRDDPAADPASDPGRAWRASEIYLMDAEGKNARRLTANTDGDGFPSLSPDGLRVVFDSNRRRVDGDPLNVSDLFTMNSDGSNQTWLVRGSLATWSPDGRRLAFHASAPSTLPQPRSTPCWQTARENPFA